ncbi:MAG: zinc metallopeptidase [bacterium]|nr:zinc metallopeptidase [bacterium]
MDLLLIILILLIPFLAQIGISSSYNKYKRIKNERQISGFEVAREILDKNGLKDIYVVETKGNLTDHYDPTKKVVRLSSEVFHGKTVASAAIAAHECGHAIQDKENYAFLRIRSAIFPIVNIATRISYYIIFIGFLLQALDLVYFGIALTALGLVFELVTLPVEFDASSRALKKIEEYQIVNSSEHAGAKSVLTAAALTYVAGVLASILQILRLLLIARNQERD